MALGVIILIALALFCGLAFQAPTSDKPEPTAMFSELQSHILNRSREFDKIPSDRTWQL